MSICGIEVVMNGSQEPQLVIINSDADTVGNIKPLAEIKKQDTRDARLLIDWYNKEAAALLRELLSEGVQFESDYAENTYRTIITTKLKELENKV